MSAERFLPSSTSEHRRETHGHRIISTDVYRIRDTETIVLLSVATAALPAFLTWVHYRVKVGKPALMPNKLWKNKAFSTVCLAILISFGVLNSMEQYSSLL